MEIDDVELIILAIVNIKTAVNRFPLLFVGRSRMRHVRERFLFGEAGGSLLQPLGIAYDIAANFLVAILFVFVFIVFVLFVVGYLRNCIDWPQA